MSHPEKRKAFIKTCFKASDNLNMKNLVLIGFSFWILSSCSRPEESKFSKVSIQIPSGFSKSSVSSLANTEPSGKKFCYGVNVTGSGIANAPSACGPIAGVFGGFAEEGGAIELLVPNGPARTFELFVYTATIGAACPAWNAAFMQSSGNALSTYASGKTEGVNISGDTAVSIAMNFPGVGSDIKTTLANPSCGGSLKGKIYSNGDVVDSNLTVAIDSQPYLEGFYNSGLGDIFGIGYFSSTNMLNPDAGSAVQFPSEIYSITRKPDSGEYYALTSGGNVVLLTLSGATGSYTSLTSANCPFNVDNCQVPEWMQSISAGFGTDLFSLDHGGNIYSLSGGNANSTGVSVEESVSQVSFY